MGRLVNTFSWSKSRDATFLDCPRQYWFQYYGSWGGWEAGIDARTREIYILKKVKTRHMWVGERVHLAIERSLKNLRAAEKPLALTVDEIVELTRAQMRSDFKSSRAGIYRKNPKSPGLFEHEYAIEVPDAEWLKIADTADRCLRNFYSSDLFTEIESSDRADWLELEDFSSFQLDGVKVHVVLDFSRKKDGEVVIYDWKTGASSGRDNRIQMACYAFYANQKWSAPPEQVHPLEVNLNRGEITRYDVTPEDLERTKAYISGSIADMKRLLKEMDRNVAVEEDFRKVNDAKICSRCKFFRVCEPDVPYGPAGPAPGQGAGGSPDTG